MRLPIFTILFLLLCSVAYADIIVNTTFDSDLTTDYAGIHTWDTQGAVNHITNISICKWYGCANLSASSSDYLNSTLQAGITENMTVIFWFKSNEALDGSPSQAFFQVGENENTKWTEEAQYGINSHWAADTNYVGGTTGTEYSTSQNSWTHYAMRYNGTHYTVWKNGVVIKDTAQDYGNLNSTIGDFMQIGRGKFGINVYGYMDEFTLWNNSVDETDILNYYNTQRLGTPPEIDIYVESIKGKLPINFSTENHTLDIDQDVVYNITLANYGTNDSGNFKYRIVEEGVTQHESTISIPAKSSTTIYYNWTPQYGYFDTYIYLDVDNDLSESGDGEINNAYYMPIFFQAPMRFHMNRTEWEDTLEPFCSSGSNAAKSACDSMSSFVSEDFTSSACGDMDQKAKKGRENAMSCLKNGINMSRTYCQYAMNHVLGWAGIVDTCAEESESTQEIHAAVNAMITFDIMAVNLTESQFQNVARNFSRMCVIFHDREDVSPYLDTDINGGNGKGFGTGMAGVCYGMVSLDSQNPTLMTNLSNQYWQYSAVHEFMEREENYYKAYKNDSFAKYQERWDYKQYSQYHPAENAWFFQRYDVANFSQYNNVYCAMAREFATDILDLTYLGSSLRGDKGYYTRGIQAGDSRSYQLIGEDSAVASAIITYYGAMCNDTDVSKAAQYVKDLRWANGANGEEQRNNQDSYVYYYLDQNTGSSPSVAGLDHIMYDNANDIFTWRNGYTYENDTIIQIDGGEERGGGHSQAQGDYLYAFGEPFLDYEQTPYEDDVRAETWKNAVSLQNTSQASEGVGGTYSQTCGNAPLNQYYGMGDCTIQGTYPNYRKFPFQYGGDIENYIGSQDGYYFGLYKWQPYSGASPVKQYYVKFGDMIVKRVVVDGNTQGEGVYHNFINLAREFNGTITTSKLTLERNDKNVQLDLIYDNTSVMKFGGGETNVTACLAKTDCSGGNKVNSNYSRYTLYTTHNQSDFIFTQHWYMDGEGVNPSASGTTDKGVSHTAGIVRFDTSGDNNVSIGSNYAQSWAFAVDASNHRVGAFNTTKIFYNGQMLISANQTLEVYCDLSSSQYLCYFNTMRPAPYIDSPQVTRVTVGTRMLANNSNYTVTRDNSSSIALASTTNETVTFDVQGGQTPVFYTITAGGNATESSPTTPTLTLTSSTGSVLLINQSTTITGGGCPADLVCILYNDTINISNPSTVSYESTGYYNFTFNTTGNENYTSATVSLTIAVTDAYTPSQSAVAQCSTLISSFSMFSTLVTLLVLFAIVGVYKRDSIKNLTEKQIIPILVSVVIVAITVVILSNVCV